MRTINDRPMLELPLRPIGWHLRLFDRGRRAPQRPYLHTRTCVAFGGGRLGVMLMRVHGAERRRRIVMLVLVLGAAALALGGCAPRDVADERAMGMARLRSGIAGGIEIAGIDSARHVVCYVGNGSRTFSCVFVPPTLVTRAVAP